MFISIQIEQNDEHVAELEAHGVEEAIQQLQHWQHAERRRLIDDAKTSNNVDF